MLQQAVALLSRLHNYSNRRLRVAVGLSGGVDSAVAALVLKRAGFDVIGVHMSNWNDEDDSLSDAYRTCEGADALKYAKLNALKLDIPLHRVSFEQEYWNEVFAPSLEAFKSGLCTPNPDTLCNNVIKFDHFVRYVREKFEVDWVATGHYARLQSEGGGSVRLLRGVDHHKDQSYFLSTVERHKLANNILFPLGTMMKDQVRQIAKEEDLPSATRRSSAGLCFVGKKKKHFVQFLADYMPQSSEKGPLIDWATGNVIGEHAGLWTMTIGQRARVGGLDCPRYVICKDVGKRAIYVTGDKQDPLLFSDTILVKSFNKIGSSMIKPFSSVMVKTHHPSDSLVEAKVSPLAGGDFLVRCKHIVEAVSPGQVLAMYQGDECLGGGIMTHSANLSSACSNLETAGGLPSPMQESRKLLLRIREESTSHQTLSV
eukprot:TRINITY_DN6195_c0_g1_i1.p2 TRINITY_DN6195_c0_g1~~TRINITY_DN6195_c0_g1_i1.p2  ORF type:complete len:428 (+),score=107.04 TRINITY_DN6195_c0_g1_i1:1528-2811(+)